MQLLPMASSPDGLISAQDAVITQTPRLRGAHHNQQRACHRAGEGGGDVDVDVVWPYAVGVQRIFPPSRSESSHHRR